MTETALSRLAQKVRHSGVCVLLRLGRLEDELPAVHVVVGARQMPFRINLSLNEA